jgi:DNA-binding CsgD family transcriptional regulator
VTTPTDSGEGPAVPVPGELPELLGRAAACLEQLQDVLTGLTRALSADGLVGNPGTPVRRRAGGPSLTRREQGVLTLVAAGLSNREIAREMRISDKTAKNYVHALLLKLGVASRTKAAFTALSEGLVDPGECGRAGRAAPGGARPVPGRRRDSGRTAVRLLTRSAAALDEAGPHLDAKGPHR